MINGILEEERYRNVKLEVEKYLRRNSSGKISLKRGSSNLFRKRENNRDNVQIDLNPFNRVINIDGENRVADVGARTTYEDFVKAVLPYSFMPAVVPELKTITVGGATTGIGVESSSFLEGLVHETIEEIEVLTAEGVLTCSEKENSDLFYGFPNSYGTFGYALKFKARLIPVKNFVKLEHIRYDRSRLFFEDIEEFSSQSNINFVDGTVFNNKEMYITLGKFEDEAMEVSDYTRNDIYYKSIRDNEFDHLTTSGYLWRWDTDWFWRSDDFGVQNKRLRKVLPKFLLGSKNYQKIMRLSHKIPSLTNKKPFEWVIQDVPIPIENCAKFLDFLQSKIGISPIWVCPTRKLKEDKWPLYPMSPNTFYINFGFWGKVQKFEEDDNHYNKLVEDKIEELGGIKSLYSTSFFDEKKFWKIYGGKKYEKLKSKYDPNSRFRNLFEKAVLGM